MSANVDVKCGQSSLQMSMEMSKIYTFIHSEQHANVDGNVISLQMSMEILKTYRFIAKHASIRNVQAENAK